MLQVKLQRLKAIYRSFFDVTALTNAMYINLFTISTRFKIIMLQKKKKKKKVNRSKPGWSNESFPTIKKSIYMKQTHLNQIRIRDIQKNNSKHYKKSNFSHHFQIEDCRLDISLFNRVCFDFAG